MSTRFARFTFPCILAILAFGAMAVLYISTPVGAGLANDSVAYIAGARSILQGKGYSDIWLDSSLEPVTHYPPLLSLSLSAFGLAGIDPLRGARILNILLFGASTVLLGLLGWRLTRSKPAGLWLAALFMLNASMLRIYVFAMSEPLFLCLSLLAFLSLDRHLASSDPAKKKIWLVLAGLCAGLASLARYSGLALLPTFGIVLFLFSETRAAWQKTWPTRLARIGLFLAGALPPILAWIIRNKLAAGNATNRTFQYHPITSDNIQPGFYNISQFLMPVETWRQILAKTGLLEGLLAILGLGLLGWLIYQGWNSLRQPTLTVPDVLSLTNILYIFAYLGAILFSISFFDASTKFQVRILAPLYVSCLLLWVGLGAWLWKRKNRTARVAVVALLAASLALSAYAEARALAEFSTSGQGYASWKWHDSLVMTSLRNLPAGTAIYTNTPPAVYLVTGRASRVLPSPIDPVDNQLRSDYQQNVQQMRTDLLTGQAVLALFDISNLEDAQGTQDIQSMVNGLTILQKAQGNILYGKP